jgi:hypothetical protein
VPPLTLIVEPEAERRFHVRVRLDVARDGLSEAVADLRWLGFDVLVEGRRRPLTCTYSRAPSNTDASKVVATPAARSALLDATVDVRMYCAGAAFDAIEAGASIRAFYGVRSATRRRYIVQDTVRQRGRPLARVEAAPFTLVPSAPATPAAPTPDAPAAAPVAEVPIRVGMPSFEATRSVTLRPFLEAVTTTRVYLRPELWSFEITTPSGRTARCNVPGHPVVPIVDFFSRVTPGARRAVTIDASTLCPRIFDAPGVYDVVPVLELVYDGANVGLDALVGTFRGHGSFVRIRPPAEADPSEFVRPLP